MPSYKMKTESFCSPSSLPMLRCDVILAADQKGGLGGQDTNLPEEQRGREDLVASLTMQSLLEPKTGDCLSIQVAKVHLHRHPSSIWPPESSILVRFLFGSM